MTRKAGQGEGEEVAQSDEQEERSQPAMKRRCSYRKMGFEDTPYEVYHLLAKNSHFFDKVLHRLDMQDPWEGDHRTLQSKMVLQVPALQKKLPDTLRDIERSY
ncbi:hypothetical protein STEG23_030545 [Scotinomys teguina]